MKRLQFEPEMLTKRPATGLDVDTLLSHFAIITYLVEPDLLRTHVHPMRGYFYRRDGKLGSYSIWHDQLRTTEGRVIRANFPLLQQLELVQEGDVSAIHSVLMQPETEFTIYLPPVAV